ncbi:MAG: DUF1638 domain-containing protein, partial [Acidimicrobiales bacterium]
QKITPWAERVASDALAHGHRVAVAYADCGTYGALDDVCARLGLTRLAGASCYELFAGETQLAALFADEPGTYLLTDFLVATFRRTVVGELGLDRFPELWGDYFANYRRLVWLAQSPTPALEAAAAAIAERFGLPLETRVIGSGTMEAQLELLLDSTGAVRA